MHLLGRTAQSHAMIRHDDRPLDEDRMLHHRIDQIRVRQARIAESQLVIGGAAPAQQLARRELHAREKIDELRLGRRLLHIRNDLRLDPGITDEPEHLAGSRTGWIVVDNGLHDGAIYAAADGPATQKSRAPSNPARLSTFLGRARVGSKPNVAPIPRRVGAISRVI
jgi:hypothetical protein